ncbi:MAG: S41 family peptidase [Bacteroidaceae bacterium]|nr:S41 family peptidase [Bacteroidaceae bacterium]
MKRLTLLYIVCAMAALSASAQKKESHNAEIARHLELFDDIYRQLDIYYVDTLSADTTIGWAIKSMLSHVDPFTQYYPENDDELRQMATGKYAGIGSIIRYNLKEERTMIIEPYEGTPSQQVGIRAGDVILTIDGVDVLKKPTDEVSAMLRGEPGTSFELRVRRPDVEEPLTFRLTRKTIQLPTVPYYGMTDSDGTGYIYLSSFSSGSTQEMRHALTELRSQGLRRLVLDLRDNGGGSIDEAVNIVNLFVQKGEKVVYTRGKLASSNREYFTTSEPLDTVTPIVVLVNGSTASAAEILSGSLQDMDRAVVMGTRTYGKGLVQAIHEVTDRGDLKITVSRYYIPSGRCIQAYDYRHLTADGRVGTVPDSLTRVFHTRGGREVRDGGGIKPDVEAKADSLASIVYDVVQSDEMLNFVTRYAARHATIAPAGEFQFSDSDYDDFVRHMQDSKFAPHRRTDEVMKLLREAARLEGCYEGAEAEFDQLEARLKTDLSTELQRQRDAVRPYLEDEIVSRYYYQRGRAQQLLRSDRVFDRAVRLLQDESGYRKILHP